MCTFHRKIIFDGEGLPKFVLQGMNALIKGIPMQGVFACGEAVVCRNL
jgi:hypothetical protein